MYWLYNTLLSYENWHSIASFKRISAVNDIDFEELDVRRKRSVTISAHDEVEEENKYVRGLVAAEKFIANYYLEIFWLTLYSLIVLGIFMERVYCKY